MEKQSVYVSLSQSGRLRRWLLQARFAVFRMRGMLPSRWVERNPVTYLMGRQAVSKGVTGNGGV